ncbi:MAG TPA: prepilin-type N-terminal cleavage/methylation domain-containing protein [bacterium]|nr:prepilin-type N-terminal cleavage/methylation domain-containing protein [bacterium]
MIKKGFTIMEILIAITILVIIFTLVTVMYVRGSRIRNVVVAYNEVGEVLTHMTDVLVNGRQNFIGRDIPGLKFAKGIDSNSNQHTLIYKDTSENLYTFEIKINTGTSTDTSLYFEDKPLDPNNKIVLVSGSGFEYYYPDGTKKDPDSTATETVTVVKIILHGKSNLPVMKNMNPIKMETLVRLKNNPSF